jgi:hypothetical protein
MSDYFGALMRSSGMALPAATGAARPVEHTAPAEVSRPEQPASLPTYDAIGEPMSQPALARTPLAVQHMTGRIAFGPAPVTLQETMPAHAMRGVPTRAAQSVASAALAMPSGEERTGAPQPLHSHALIDAALRWVAAGDQPDAHGPLTHARGRAASFAESSGHMASASMRIASVPDAPIVRTHPSATPTDAGERRTVPLQPLRSESRSNVPAVVAPAVDRDPPLDISIGAIHVRVDAPAAQTVTQAPAPRSFVAPRAETGRRALARRALRRI